MKRCALFALFIAFFFACKSPKPGDACTKNICTGAERALLCVFDRYVAAECKGGGCTSSPFACDYRENANGAPCYEAQAPGAPLICTADRKARTQCKRGTTVREACEGPKGCYEKGESSVLCDRLVRAGGECSGDSDVCSSDGLDWLECKDGALVVIAKCRGPNHCTRALGSLQYDVGVSIACDTSVGEPDDTCLGTIETCSVDKRAVLGCESRHLVVRTRCPAGKTCSPQEPSCE